MNWTITEGEYTITTAMWPLWVTLGGPTLAIVSALVSFLLWGRGLGRPVIALNLGFLAVFAGMVTTGLPWLFVGAASLTSDDGPLRVFRDLALYEAWGAGAGVALTGVSGAIWVGMPRAEGGIAPPWERIGLWLGAVALSFVGVLHAVWLASVGPIPELLPTVPARIHTRLVLDIALDVPGWQVPTVHTVAHAPGDHPVSLTASRRGVHVTRTWSILAGADRLDEGLRLQPRDEWIYESTTSWHDQILWFISSPGRAKGPLTRVRVLGERIDNARRLLDVEVTQSGEKTTFTVFPWEGKAFLEDSETIFWSIEATRDSDGAFACEFAAFPGTCHCVTRAPGDPVFLPGPSRCAWTSGGAVSTGVSLFLAVVTAGLVLQDPDREHYVELVASGNGPQMPESAFAAPPVEPAADGAPP